MQIYSVHIICSFNAYSIILQEHILQHHLTYFFRLLEFVKNKIIANMEISTKRDDNNNVSIYCVENKIMKSVICS